MHQQLILHYGVVTRVEHHNLIASHQSKIQGCATYTFAYIAALLLQAYDLCNSVIVTSQNAPQTCPHQLQDESGSKGLPKLVWKGARPYFMVVI